MTLVIRVRNLAALAVASICLALASPAFAQEISPAHLKAARAAVAAIKATDYFDAILPASAGVLKRELIQKNPDLQQLISTTVDQKTLEFAARRTDLEKEAALAYARVFSEEDLNTIATFYNTPAGKKLISDGPTVTREVAKAAEIWQNGIVRDLTEAVRKELEPSIKALDTPPDAATAEPAKK